MDYLIWSVLLVIIIFIILKIQRKSYFSERGIPRAPEWPFFGILHALFFPRRHINELMTYIYNINKEAKYIGVNVFLMPTIFIRDRDLIKTILVKNFDYFADRKTFVDEKVDPLFGQNLNFLNGDRWRQVRNTLSPAFTSSKMKLMFVLISKCAKNFVEEFWKQYNDKNVVDMKDAFGRYTNDVIASCAFGIEIDSLKYPTNEFYMRTSESTTFKGLTMLKFLLEIAFPWLTRKMRMRIVSKEVTDFFTNIVSESIKVRKEKNINRPDMLQLLIEAKEKMTDESNAKFDLQEMTAQAFFFILAGYEASSIQACIIAHELAVNPEIQEKVNAEIETAMKATNGELTYEVINNMPYLDAVFSESLRMHAIAFLNRLCSKEFELPSALPGFKPYKVMPGENIMIPVAAIHKDPDIYENPEKFDPSRFVDKKVAVSDITNLGFGLGPRMCLGNRFAILEIKVLLVHLLVKCNLVPCEKTCIPMRYCPNNFAAVPKGGFWLKLNAKN